jgi:hypothetical protein
VGPAAGLVGASLILLAVSVMVAAWGLASIGFRDRLAAVAVTA